MCDKVQEGDQRYGDVRNTVNQTGCIEFNDKLDVCLKASDKDWRKCRKEVMELGKCYRERNLINK